MASPNSRNLSGDGPFTYSGQEIAVRHNDQFWQVRVGSRLDDLRDGMVYVSAAALSPNLGATLYVCEIGQPLDHEDGRRSGADVSVSGYWGWQVSHLAQPVASGFAKRFGAAFQAATEAMMRADEIMAARRLAKERLIDDMNDWLHPAAASAPAVPRSGSA